LLNKIDNTKENNKKLKLCNDILATDNKYIEVYLKRAKIYMELEDYKNARKDCMTIKKIDPNEAEAYNILGKIRMSGETKLSKSNYSWAKQYFSRAVEIKPDNPEFYFNRGLCHYRGDGTLNNALDDLKSAVKYSKTYSNKNYIIPKSYIILGKICLEKKDFDDAENYFSMAIETEPNNAEHYLERAKYYCQTKKYKRSVKDVEHSLKIDPNLNDEEVKDILSKISKGRTKWKRSIIWLIWFVISGSLPVLLHLYFSSRFFESVVVRIILIYLYSLFINMAFYDLALSKKQILSDFFSFIVAHAAAVFLLLFMIYWIGNDWFLTKGPMAYFVVMGLALSIASLGMKWVVNPRIKMVR